MSKKWSIGVVVPVGGSAKNSLGEWVEGGDTGLIGLNLNGAKGHENAIFIHSTDEKFASLVCDALEKIGEPDDA